MIYVSSGGFRDRAADLTSRELLAAGIDAIELSGGAYTPDLLDRLRDLSPDIRFQVHNYFPPPANPFVLNLGSLDREIAARSVAHVEEALRWCVSLGADRYSVHAGFLLDPRVDELGSRIPSRNLFDRDECIDAFVRRVTRLASTADKAGVSLMIENNVLSAKNAQEFPHNPLLMCDPQECRQIMQKMPANVMQLIDVAHLKVSANSLRFEAVEMFEMCEERIAGYHLSDNDGLEDSNKEIGPKAWFWPYLKRDVDYCSVEVYGRTPDQLRQQVILVQSRLES